MKELNSSSLNYKEQDPEMIKMFENYNRILQAVEIFITCQFILLIALF